MTPRVRRAGARWRLLVHDVIGRGYGTARDIRNYPRDRDPDEYTQLPNAEFDELVVGQWLHVEQNDTGQWGMTVGGVHISIRVDRDGRAKHVFVSGPDDWAGRVAGCEYELHWTEFPSAPSTPGGGESHSKINESGSAPLFTDKEAAADGA